MGLILGSNFSFILDDVQACIILYLISSAGGRGLLRTEVIKLAYLVDRENYRRLGKTVFSWRKWFYGPFSSDILDVLDFLEEEGLVEAKIGEDYIAYVVHVDRRIKVLLERIKEELPEYIITVENVWRRYREEFNCDLTRLLKYIYSLKEVKEKDIGEDLLRDKLGENYE